MNEMMKDLYFELLKNKPGTLDYIRNPVYDGPGFCGMVNSWFRCRNIKVVWRAWKVGQTNRKVVVR